MPKNKRFLLLTWGFSSPFVMVGLGVVAVLLASSIQTTQNLSAGTQNVLGEEGQSEQQKQEEEAAKDAVKQKEEAQKESEKQEKEQKKEADKARIKNSTGTSASWTKSIKSKSESVSANGIKTKTETEGNKQETEIETADGQKIKTKIEDDGTTKIEVKDGTVKLEYRIENGQVVLKAENEDGEEVEFEDEELEELENEVEDELEDDDVRLVATTDNRLALTQNQVAALTDFPLSINVETKELVITTPAGQKTVAVLPQQAVQNLLATGIVNKIEVPPADVANQDQLGTLTGVVKIEMRNNEVVYRIKGTKTHRLLGLIPVPASTTAFVSADTGTTVATQQSLLTGFIDLLSL